MLSDSSNSKGNDETNKNKIIGINLIFKFGYAGHVVFGILQLAKRDSKMIRRVGENKENQINTVTIFDNIKQLTAGRMYHMDEVVLGRECLQHARNAERYKEK